MPVGAGLCPAGFSPAGYGLIDTAVAPGPTALPDPRTGVSDGGRYINQSTGDYVFTSDGRLLGMPNVYQLVLIALENTIDFSRLQEKGPNFPKVVRTIIQNALADLVTKKMIQIRKIVVQSGQPNMNPDATIAIVNWVDLTTGLAGEPVSVTP